MKNINIKAVTQLTGLNANTLRAWERRYDTLSPSRDLDGRRVYDKKDLEKLSLLATLVQNGHLIGNLATLNVNQLKDLVLQHKIPVQIRSDLINENEKYLNQIIEALVEFDLNKVQDVLQSTKFDLSPRQIVTDLVLPLLSQVGHLVADSQLSIAQEHLLSSLLRDYLGQIYQSLSPYDFKIKMKVQKIALTTREGDLHEFGILLAAILCRINNIQTFYFGPNMPASALADACAKFKIDSLILSFVKLPQSKECISPEKYIQELDRLLPTKIKILTGGSLSSSLKLKNEKRQVIHFSLISELDSFLATLQ